MRHHARPPADAPANQSTRNDWGTLKTLLPYLWAYKWRVIFALLCLVFAKVANVAVPLPLPGLIRTFTAPTAVPMVSNFALVYIEMGLPRVSAAERAALVPALLVGVGQRPAAQQVRWPDNL